MINPFFRNVSFIKANAVQFLTQLGYHNVGYEGSDAGLLVGGYCWYQAVSDSCPNAVFTMKLRKQGDSLKLVFDRVITPTC